MKWVYFPTFLSSKNMPWSQSEFCQELWKVGVSKGDIRFQKCLYSHILSGPCLIQASLFQNSQSKKWMIQSLLGNKEPVL